MNLDAFKNVNFLKRRYLDGLKSEIDALRVQYPRTRIGLAIVQVGNRDDSNLYIKHKLKSAQEVGIDARHVKFDRDVTLTTLLAEIGKLNADTSIHGIIVQLPFDSVEPIDSDCVVNAVSPQKVPTSLFYLFFTFNVTIKISSFSMPTFIR